MALDTGTLVTALLVVCVVIACLLAFTWVQHRGVPTLGTWVVCFALCAAAAVLVAARGPIPEFLAVDAANTLRLLAFGLGWQAARQFGGQRGNWALAVAPAVLWLTGSLLSVYGEDYRLRMLLSSPIIAAYAFAIAGELWRASPRGAWIARAAVVVLVLHGATYVARFLAALLLTGSGLQTSVAQPLNPISLLEMLVVAIALSVLLVSAVKDQMLLRYRHAALIDPLTGVGNRRGFGAEAGRMLARACRDGSSTALLLLDLDHFKAVNDSWGHLVGDRALQAFTDTVAAELRRGDLMGRLGGEEFAVALADCRTDQALVLAERIRRAVAACTIRDGAAEVRLTVSIGVASMRGAESLDELLKEADAALYRAKAGGRDRVDAAADLRARSAVRVVGDAAAAHVA